MALCRLIKKQKLFSTGDAAPKVIYLAVQAASKKWTRPVLNWNLELNLLIIFFEDREPSYF
jgi:transposase-like protein